MFQRSGWVAAGCASISWGVALAENAPGAACEASYRGPQQPIAYVSNQDKHTLSAVAIAGDGALTALGSPTPSGGLTPFGVAITPDSKYLYVAHTDSSTIVGFSIGADGTLSRVGAALPTDPKNVGRTREQGGPGAFFALVTPNGRYLYVSNMSATTVAGYSIAADGSLSALPGSPFELQAKGPRGLAISPDGRYLYSLNFGAPPTMVGSITMFSVAADGKLTPVHGSPLATGKASHGAVFTPDGRYLIAINTFANDISVFKTARDGKLEPVSGSPFAAVSPQDVGITADGRYVYTLSETEGALLAFSIEATGRLRPLSTMHWPTGAQGKGLIVFDAVVTPDGNYVYAVNHLANSIAGFAIHGNGSLTALPGSPFTALVSVPAGMAIAPDQPPVACFTAAPAEQGWSFDASASHDVDGGSVVSYEWDFGDGRTAIGSSPKATHSYAKSGNYTVTLTLTDNAGCSTKPIFNGMSMLCNGSSIAQTSQRVTWPSPHPSTR